MATKSNEETAQEQIERLRVVKDEKPAPVVVMNAEVAAKLREPFKDSQIGKLPRLTCSDCSKASGKVCSKHEKRRCSVCHGFLSEQHIHLDYVGHAATTDRLLAVDPYWTWEPFAVDDDGLPKLDQWNGLWIKLTVAGVTRPGYGDASNGKGVKELIGDALRNGSMRFGVAIDLWSKEDLIAPEPAEDGQGSEQASKPTQGDGKGQAKPPSVPAAERPLTAAQAKKVRDAAAAAELEPVAVGEIIAVVTQGAALGVEGLRQKQAPAVVQAFKDFANDPAKGAQIVEAWRVANPEKASALDAIHAEPATAADNAEGVTE